MKRIFALCLCALLLCAAALAEAAPEATVYDFDDFTIEVPAGAVVQQAEKADGAAFFACYPNAGASGGLADNYTISWMDDDFSISFANVDATTLAQAYLDYTAGQNRAQGMTIENVQLLSAAYDASGQTLSAYATMDVDYAPLGINMALTLHQAFLFLDLGEHAGYILSFYADDAQGLQALIDSAAIQLA